ncbi:type II secretion system protein [Candidatus Saccharibacteria bacterium]|nr:type II secretion system protein [Candidatus Saccharibacteria bacterium]
MLNIKKQLGYTIVEALIVLAVMGTLFISTSLLIRGRIQAYQYKEGMNSARQIIQDITNDTANGYFGGVQNGKSNETILGKSILFCANPDTVDRDNCNNNPNNIVVKTLKNDKTQIDTKVLALPGGLKYIKSIKNSDLTTNSGSFGYSVVFTEENKGPLGVKVKTYGFNDIGNGYKVCLEGQKKGSLVIGSNGGSTAVGLNMVDNDCN